MRLHRREEVVNGVILVLVRRNKRETLVRLSHRETLIETAKLGDILQSLHYGIIWIEE